MALAVGTKLGPYEIQSQLGAGGMGEVYGARDTRLGRTVAIKILPAHLSQSADARERFDREARAISSLNHPNICHLYDVGSQEGTSFLVMEYLEGGPWQIGCAKDRFIWIRCYATGGRSARGWRLRIAAAWFTVT